MSPTASRHRDYLAVLVRYCDRITSCLARCGKRHRARKVGKARAARQAAIRFRCQHRGHWRAQNRFGSTSPSRSAQTWKM